MVCKRAGVVIRAWCAWTAALLGLSTLPTRGESPPRDSDPDLLALYRFERTREDVVRDHSGHSEPLDLRIETPQAVARRAKHLEFRDSARVATAGSAKRLAEAIRRSNALSIETWLRPLDAQQKGPARIVTLSADTGQRNVTLGQDGDRFEARLRTSLTNANGIPATLTPPGSARAELTHVVFTRDVEGNTRIFVNGRETAREQRAGDLANWSTDFRFALGNELTGDRPWRGELHRVALFARALSVDEVARRFRDERPMVDDWAARLPPAVERRVSFVQDIEPLLRRRCFECHAGETEEGGFSLANRERALAGSASGRVIDLKRSEASRLMQLVTSSVEAEAMPPAGERLTRDEVALLRAWIDQGLEWPEGRAATDPRLERARTHWAFQPLRLVPLPTSRDSTWSATPIDSLLFAKLAAAGLRPSRPADSRQWLRRATFDLTGLPPAPEEVEEFERQWRVDSGLAREAAIDRLLSSPRYGERWARHWLDVAHYADSDGMESDRDRPRAFPYRDFVIRSFNDDRPYDEFVRWQLAGDEIAPGDPAAVAATGFLATGPHEVLDAKLLEEERLRARFNELDDALSTIGTGLLGLTLGCARCHDHKYDAVTSREYYRLLAALQAGDRSEWTLGAGDSKGLGYRDAGGEPSPTWFFRRADFYDRREPVRLGFPALLTRGVSADWYWERARANGSRSDTTYQRRALAEWLTDVERGAGALAARVIVNRLWLHLFGEPLVESVGDFGARAPEPAQLDLLDWLASELVRREWRLKPLQRLILSSSAYAQTSLGAEGREADPSNRWWGRRRVRRIEAEALRDAMLAAAGALNLEAYGPAFKPPIAPDAMLARNLKDPYPAQLQESAATHRRSIYLFHKRVVPYPLLQAFDKPDAQQSCGRRDRTTVAPQALALLNDPFVRGIAREFAERLRREAGDDDGRRVERAYALALGRSPAEVEWQASLEFLAAQTTDRLAGESASPNDPGRVEAARRLALADFAQALLSLNEFIYLD